MNVKLLLGGLSSEREISLMTGDAVAEAVSGRHNIEKIYWNKGSAEDLIPVLRGCDMVFIGLHGGDGENGTVQKILDQHQIRYTGSGPESSLLAMDKAGSKDLVRKLGENTPDWVTLNNPKEKPPAELMRYFSGPVVVKPNAEGSTVGLTIVEHENRLTEALELADRYPGPILVEQYIAGRELTVGILGNRALPIVEIQPKHDHYDFDCKYTPGMSEYICPAQLEPHLTQQIQEAAVRIHKSLRCRHYSRIDFRLDSGGRYYFLEANTLPGMTGTSLLPKAAAAEGINYSELIDSILKIARTEQ